MLVEREPDGVAAGELARVLAVPHNTLSAHLGVLERAGLIAGERHGRSIIYRRPRRVRTLVASSCRIAAAAGRISARRSIRHELTACSLLHPGDDRCR